MRFPCRRAATGRDRRAGKEGGKVAAPVVHATDDAAELHRLSAGAKSVASSPAISRCFSLSTAPAAVLSAEKSQPGGAGCHGIPPSGSRGGLLAISRASAAEAIGRDARVRSPADGADSEQVEGHPAAGGEGAGRERATSMIPETARFGGVNDLARRSPGATASSIAESSARPSPGPRPFRRAA
jgi:hypothetical protein